MTEKQAMLYDAIRLAYADSVERRGEAARANMIRWRVRLGLPGVEPTQEELEGPPAERIRIGLGPDGDWNATLSNLAQGPDSGDGPVVQEAELSLDDEVTVLTDDDLCI